MDVSEDEKRITLALDVLFSDVYPNDLSLEQYGLLGLSDQQNRDQVKARAKAVLLAAILRKPQPKTVEPKKDSLNETK